jgi:hypothetical protein
MCRLMCAIGRPSINRLQRGCHWGQGLMPAWKWRLILGTARYIRDRQWAADGWSAGYAALRLAKCSAKSELIQKVTIIYVLSIWGYGLNWWKIWGYRRDGDEICALRRYYAALSSSSVPTFRDNLSVTSSRVKYSDMWRCVFVVVFPGASKDSSAFVLGSSSSLRIA